MKKKEILASSTIPSSPVPVTFWPGDPPCCYSSAAVSRKIFQLCCELTLYQVTSFKDHWEQAAASLPPSSLHPPPLSTQCHQCPGRHENESSASFLLPTEQMKTHHKAQAQPLLQEHRNPPQPWIPHLLLAHTLLVKRKQSSTLWNLKSALCFSLLVFLSSLTTWWYKFHI